MLLVVNEVFSIAVVFRGELFKILTFWGLTGVRFLFLSYFLYENIEMFTFEEKKTHFRTPLPDLRPDSETWMNFGLE
jgi:hypothetical protein